MLAVLLGIVVGVLAGLIPGVHTNLVAVVVAGLSWDVEFAAVFLVAVAISRSVVDAVPTVFLGAAETENVMALLPSHKLLKKGFGVEAVKFFVAGSVLGVAGGVVLVPVFLVLFPFLFSLLRPWMFWVLLALVLVLLMKERKWWAVAVFGLSGLLGVVVLDGVREPLFPLLSGLFGASGLVLSLLNRVEIPLQFESDVLRVRRLPLLGAVASGVLAGSVVTLFPGLGPSQAAALAQLKRVRSVRYLVLVGALGTVDVLVSLVTFFALGRARNGAVVVIEQLAGGISAQTLAVFVAVACVAAGVAAVAALFAAKWYAALVELVDYEWISGAVLVLLLIMSVVLSGWLGPVVLVTATAVGLLAPLTGVSRSHAMGCLLVPTLLFLW